MSKLEFMKRKSIYRRNKILRDTIKVEVLGIPKDGKIRDEFVRKDLWVIRQQMRLIVSSEGQIDKVFDMPEYYPTDYASYPTAIQKIWNKRDDDIDIPSAWHDYLARNRKDLGISLMFCHAVYEALLKKFDNPSWQVGLVYTGVVLGNWAVSLGKGRGELPNFTHRDIDRICKIRKEFRIETLLDVAR